MRSETRAKDRRNQAKLELINKRLENRALNNDTREKDELAMELLVLCEQWYSTKASPEVSITKQVPRSNIEESEIQRNILEKIRRRET